MTQQESTVPFPGREVPTPPNATISADRQVQKNQPDKNGDTVTDVFIHTDHFIIYAADGREDCDRLRFVLPDSYEVAREYRRKLAPIAGDLASVGNVIDGLPNRAPFANLRRRTLFLMARAMQEAFEDNPAAAVALIREARDEAVHRRDSRNRMRYIFANALALLVILGLWVANIAFGFPLPEPLTELRDFLTVSADGEAGATGAFRVVDVLAMGALGAFFAVSAAINQVRVTYAISTWEMVYTGFIRVAIGVIASGVVVFLIWGGWILASIADPYRLPSLYLFAFLAGFSELFVPNALKQVEDGTRADAPGDRRRPAAAQESR